MEIQHRIITYTFYWSISTTLRKRYVFTTCLLIINIRGIRITQSCWHRLFLNLEEEQKRFLANSNCNVYLTCFTKCQQGFFVHSSTIELIVNTFANYSDLVIKILVYITFWGRKNMMFFIISKVEIKSMLPP